MNSTAVLQENLDCARGFIEQAGAVGADIVVLPENFSLMPATGSQRRDAAQRADEVEAMLSRVARDQGVVIVGGSTPLPAVDPASCTTARTLTTIGSRFAPAFANMMTLTLSSLGFF